jgi:uncharacterized membrane protein
MLNKLPSQHWFVFFLSVFFVSMSVFMHYVLDLAGATTEDSIYTPFTALFFGTAIWWIFALISGIRPEYTQYRKDDPRYIKWLLLLPVSVLIMNFFIDYGEHYTGRLVFFTSILVTYIGILIWICADWYRWKYNPTERQQRVIARELHRINRRAEIDKIPDCMVLYGLYFENLSPSLTRTDVE